MFQECFKLTALAVALAVLAVGLLFSPLTFGFSTLTIPLALKVVIAAELAVGGAAAAGASAGVGYSAYELCTR